jgi:hypothetical protein
MKTTQLLDINTNYFLITITKSLEFLMTLRETKSKMGNKWENKINKYIPKEN